MSTKYCAGCKTEKPVEAFHKCIGTADGLQRACAACMVVRVKRSRQKNRQHYRGLSKKYYGTEKVFDSRLRYLFGITYADYQQMLAAQDGKCAICKADKPGRRNKRFSVDHCHETGVIRGLLCHQCNIGLGSFDDDHEIMTDAINYLLKFEVKIDRKEE